MRPFCRSWAAFVLALAVALSSSPAWAQSGSTNEATPSSPTATSPRLSRRTEDRDDSDSSHLVYIGAQFGVAYLDSVVFSNENFIPGATRQNGTGVTTGVIAGLHLWFLTVGGRFTYSSFDPFDVGTIGLDLGLRIPFLILEPYVRLGLAYAFTASAGYGGRTDSDVDGLALDLGLGVDFSLLHWLAVGLGVDAGFLNLTRGGIDNCTTPTCQVEDIDFSESGDAAGLLLRFLAQVRIDFL